MLFVLSELNDDIGTKKARTIFCYPCLRSSTTYLSDNERKPTPMA